MLSYLILNLTCSQTPDNKIAIPETCDSLVMGQHCGALWDCIQAQDVGVGHAVRVLVEVKDNKLGKVVEGVGEA